MFSGNKSFGDSNLKLADKEIERTRSIKYLGINIDEKLTWKDHISFRCNKLSKYLGILYIITPLLNSDVSLIMYYALFYPYLHYCSVVWGMATKTLKNPLVLIQKKILRTMSNVNKYEHTSQLFKNFKILTIADIYQLERLKLIHEQLNRQNIFQLITAFQTHSIHTRNSQLLRPLFPCTELQKRFVTYYGCKKFNDLPVDLKNIQNKDTFKIKVKQHLLRYYYKSFNISRRLPKLIKTLFNLTVYILDRHGNEFILCNYKCNSLEE